MSATPVSTQPRFMRDNPAPVLPVDLDKGMPRWIARGLFSLSELRSAAQAALRRVGLPASGAEDFGFMRVNEFVPHLGPVDAPIAYAPGSRPSPAEVAAWLGSARTGSAQPGSAQSGAAENLIVLVDGVYDASLSNPGRHFQVTSLADSIEGMEAAQREALLRLISDETDAPAALAAVYSEKPLLIRLTAKATPAEPLQILHVRTRAADAAGLAPACNDPSNRIDALIVYHGAKLSEASIQVRHVIFAGASDPKESSPLGLMENILTVALLDEAASLKFFEAGCFADAAPAGLGFADRDVHFRKLTARLDRNARLLAVSAHTGSRLARQAFSVDLAGEGSEAEIDGAAVLTGSRQSHNHVRVRHLVPHCVSRQLFKSVAADQSRSSVDGTIYVAPDAQQTNAYQLINNLMLSDEARADSKPRLMIYADDVKCSHGATAGKLDPAQQFYLESRGLPPDQARAVMTVAFIAEVLDKVGKTGAANEGARDAIRTEHNAFRTELDHALLDSLRAKVAEAQQASVAAAARSANPDKGKEARHG